MPKLVRLLAKPEQTPMKLLYFVNNHNADLKTIMDKCSIHCDILDILKPKTKTKN